MNLSEFKEQLDTDAQRRCKVQEETIRNLNHTNKQLLGLLQDRDEDIVTLQNRCFALCRGSFCLLCGMKHTCVRKGGRQQ